MPTLDLEQNQLEEYIHWECPICGTPCKHKKITRPTSSISAMAMQFNYSVWQHLWNCPRAFEEWHMEAENLIHEGQKSHSKRVRNLIWEDLIEHLAENGVEAQDFERRMLAANQLEDEDSKDQ
jgi:hypothetical protein